jgi:hypothetical protein
MTAVCPRALMLVKAPSVDRRNSPCCPRVWQPAPIRSTAQPLAETCGQARHLSAPWPQSRRSSAGIHSMTEAIAYPLPSWGNFYVIVGSAAAGLTGLMFVVMELITGNQTRVSSLTISAFGTPTVVHFCVALLISATLSAPWHELANAGLALGISGTAGLIYVAIIVRRARRQTSYTPVLEDWLWHAVLPFIAYAAIDVAAIELRANPEPALFVVATAAVLLVVVGIHNAWDTVTYIAVKRSEGQSDHK